METDYKSKVTMDPSGFVLLSDYVPSIVQEIRYFSTYNFIGDRKDGYEQPCAIITVEAARALKAVSNELNVMMRNGFQPIDCEWWHFTLKDEPYLDTYFEFLVSADYLLKGRS